MFFTALLKKLLREGELQDVSVYKDFLHTAADGKNYNTKNRLKMIYKNIFITFNGKKSSLKKINKDGNNIKICCNS
jgi:hypothetical protein